MPSGICGIWRAQERALERIAPGQEIDRFIVGKIRTSLRWTVSISGASKQPLILERDIFGDIAVEVSIAGLFPALKINIRAGSCEENAGNARSCPVPRPSSEQARRAFAKPAPSLSRTICSVQTYALAIQRIGRA